MWEKTAEGNIHGSTRRDRTVGNRHCILAECIDINLRTCGVGISGITVVAEPTRYCIRGVSGNCTCTGAITIVAGAVKVKVALPPDASAIGIGTRRAAGCGIFEDAVTRNGCVPDTYVN